MAAKQLSGRIVRSAFAAWLVPSLLCACTPDRPSPVYPSQPATGALAGALLGGLFGGDNSAARSPLWSGLAGGLLGAGIGGSRHTTHLRVARALLYSGEEEGGTFGVFSYLIAAQKDPASPVGQRLQAAIDVYSWEAPYCPSDQIGPSHTNLFVVPVTSTRPPDADRALCKGGSEVSALLFAEYDTARASALAYKAGLDGQGPYLIASLKPLSMRCSHPAGQFGGLAKLGFGCRH